MTADDMRVLCAATAERRAAVGRGRQILKCAFGRRDAASTRPPPLILGSASAPLDQGQRRTARQYWRSADSRAAGD